jgi:hypothetical protein
MTNSEEGAPMRPVLWLLAVAGGLAACEGKRWQPYFVPDDDPQRGIVPNVTFETVLECQQYLLNRFGNVRGAATFYCFPSCRKVDPSTPIPSGTERLGDLDCPRSDRQIVGQLIG